MQNQMNPYEPNVPQSIPIDPPKKLSGFFRGARNGLLWSLPLYVALTIHIATYGPSPSPVYAAMLEAFQISAIWILVAGLVAAIADRDKQ